VLFRFSLKKLNKITFSFHFNFSEKFVIAGTIRRDPGTKSKNQHHDQHHFTLVSPHNTGKIRCVLSLTLKKNSKNIDKFCILIDC
jgi:hypothetical protein